MQTRQHLTKIIKNSKHDVWNDVLEEDELTQLAWGDWYQWDNKDIYCPFWSWI